MSNEPLSRMDRNRVAEDVDYLIRPRGPGTGWVFRKVTSAGLVAPRNPWTGKPSGNVIARGLGPRRPTAAK